MLEIDYIESLGNIEEFDYVKFLFESDGLN